MRRALADIANELARWTDNRNKKVSAGLYRLATRLDPTWSAPWYNLGLQAKYERRWKESLELNQRAVQLDPSDEAACWNLAIAATALRDWRVARYAWKGAGVDVKGNDAEEVKMETCSACVRLDPDGRGEVVWGDRVDPVRLLVLNVPLPESGHRFRDIVLNDGASKGTRCLNGTEYPVFDELERWQPSDYATFEVAIEAPGEDAVKRLVDLCNQNQLGIEDWSTIRIICKQCSEGNLGPHECSKSQPNGRRQYALAARTEHDLVAVLGQWTAMINGARYFDVRMVVPI